MKRWSSEGNEKRRLLSRVCPVEGEIAEGEAKERPRTPENPDLLRERPETFDARAKTGHIRQESLSKVYFNLPNA
jgi:hypothetical protein